MDQTVHIADLADAVLDGQRAIEVYAQANNLPYDGKVGVETAGLVTVPYATMWSSSSTGRGASRSAIPGALGWGGMRWACRSSAPGRWPRWAPLGQLVGGWDQTVGVLFALPLGQ